jgi:Etoposide-induced protein 2.4 (EI24)
MVLILDSFWRAALYCLHPKVILLSLLPLLLLALAGGGLGYFYWDGAVHAVWLWVSESMFFSALLDFLSRFGMGGFRTAIAPLIVIALATPVLIVLVMLVVALMMTPALLKLVSSRRFERLTQSGKTSLWRSALWSLGSTMLALFLLVASIPFWFVPPLVLILPPLIWGWLTYRVMSFDALADHASPKERRAIFKEHRMQLLGIGIVAGYLGALPSLIWAAGAMAAVFAIVLLPIALWLYTLIFAFSSLWFIHYCLGALEQHRAIQVPLPAEVLPLETAPALKDSHHA